MKSVKKGFLRKGGCAFAAAIALTLAFASSAYAGIASSTVTTDAVNWTPPTAPMTNTVDLNGKTYKVITTWQNAWGTSGADYLGISNSSILNSAGSAGGGNIQNALADAQNKTMLGVWASVANEVPNAYNWNSFYQFYVDAHPELGLADAPFTCVYTVDYDSSCGVCGPFKYRPEIVGSSRLGAAAESTAIEQINKGVYYTGKNGSEEVYTNGTGEVTVVTDALIESASASGYNSAVEAAKAKAASAYPAQYNAEKTTFALKGSAARTQSISNTLASADAYQALGGADVKDAQYDASTASEALQAEYTTAVNKFENEGDKDKIASAKYTIATVKDRNGNVTGYTITFDFAMTDYSTTFTVTFNSNTDVSKYYVPGDESYDPYRFAYNNGTAFTFVESFYQVAKGAEQIIADTKDYKGTDTSWKQMNLLPRTTRYEQVGLSANDCATNVEKLIRGSIYYTLAKIADGTTTKKTVAYLTGSPNATGTTANIAVFDYIDSIGQGVDNGYAGASPLTVNQLGADDYGKADSQWAWTLGASATVASSTASSNPNDSIYDYSFTANSSYAVWRADVSADYLAKADVIECLNGSMTESELQSWMEANVTAGTDVSHLTYITKPGTVMSSANFTSEKLMNTIYVINCAYPDLFPNLELMSYWYDEIYHMNTANVAQALQWGFANASMPNGTELADLATTYSLANIEKKFYEGYEYYAKEIEKGTGSSDETIARLCSNKGLNGATSFTASGTEVAFTFNDWKASDSYKNWAEKYAKDNAPSTPSDEPAAAKKANTMTAKAKAKVINVKFKTLKKKAVTIQAKKAFTVKNAKGKVTFKKVSGSKKITVAKNGKITIKKGAIKKGKTVTIKVKVTAAGNSSYKSATKTVTLKIKAK